MSPKVAPSKSEQPLTVKELCFVTGLERTTIWRRKREGYPFLGGRILWSTWLWCAEQRDQARAVGLPFRSFAKLPRARQVELFAAAMVVRKE